MKVHGLSFLAVLMSTSMGFTSHLSFASAAQEDLGAVKAVRRTVTLELSELLKQCKEGGTGPTDRTYECRVKSFELNGTENLLNSSVNRTSGQQGQAIFYDDNENGTNTFFEITAEGYRFETYLGQSNLSGQQSLRRVFEKNKLEGKKISILIHWAPSATKSTAR